MKKVLTLSVAIMMLAGVASADVMGVYSDAAGTNCNGPVAMFVPVTSYVVHHTVGATGSQWKINDLTGLTQLGSTPGAGFLSIGTPYTDQSLAYTSCNPGPAIMMMSLQHFAGTAPGNCLVLELVAAPGKPYPIAVNCDFAELPAVGTTFTFNGNMTDCPCGPPNATEQSTWGKVKSLYR